MGARVWLSKLPVPSAVTRAAGALGLDPWRLAVSGGEDFELLFALPAGDLSRCLAQLEQSTGTPGTVIGEVLEPEAGVQFVDARGELAPVEHGFEHFTSRQRVTP